MSRAHPRFTMFTKTSQKLASIFSVTLFAVSIAGCAADASENDGRVDTKKQDNAIVDPVVAPVMIDQTKKDAVVQVGAGQAIILSLPSNATTGFEWSITSKDAPFGEPTVSDVIEGDGMGAGGRTQFTWVDTKTVSPGRYTISLEYKRSWEPAAADTFSFVVEITN